MNNRLKPTEECLQIMNISYREFQTNKGIELITSCLFNDCDKDSQGKEAHLYFNKETGQYKCHKCGEKGNIITLAKHLGIPLSKVFLNSIKNIKKIRKDDSQKRKKVSFSPELVEKCYKDLTEEARNFLINRGITEQNIKDYKIGYGSFHNKNFITLPIKVDGDYKFFKLRAFPYDDPKKPKYIFFGDNSGAELYNEDFDTFTDSEDRIMICEGEFDKILANNHGIRAVSGTNGAQTFKDEWVDKLIKYSKIYIAFDNDETGRLGAKRIAELFTEKGHKNIYIIKLPESVGEKGDITDYFIKLSGNENDLFERYSVKYDREIDIHRIIHFDKTERDISYDDWRKIISANFPDLLFSAEISCSILAQILIRDITNPFALVLVDVPSAGKTITVNFFSGIDGLSYATDKFTPSAFVSNSANVKKEKLSEIDLLPRLKSKLFIIRDLATIFSKRDDDLIECLGILTRVLDGEGLSTDTGVHGRREYSGDYLFMILAASTPIPPRVWRMMSNLGSRLFFLNLNTPDKSNNTLIQQLVSKSHKVKEKECKNITKDFLHTLWEKHKQGVDWNSNADPQECMEVIVNCARLLACLRGVINYWKDDGTSETGHIPPTIEKPDRISQLFYNLCRGHALICGRNQISHEDLKFILRITFDSGPLVRSNLLKAIINTEKDGLFTSEVEKILNCSKPTALADMKNLKILGICTLEDKFNSLESSETEFNGKEMFISLKEDFSWFRSEECRKLLNL